MTLVEFIVVVVLIGVLVAFIFPSSGPKRRSKLIQAQKDMADLKGAIEVFRHDYIYLPVSARTATLTNADFTFGTFQTRTNIEILNGATAEANNSEVCKILSGQPAPAGTPPELDLWKRNPQKNQYFNAKPSGDTHSPGLGTDGVFRDPWGNPYILTLDLDGDGQCKDAFYRKASVSRMKPPSLGTKLTNSVNVDGLSDDFALAEAVMIWSFGPDGKVSPTERADTGVNRDNVLGWR